MGLVADQQVHRLPVHAVLVPERRLVGADGHAGLAGRVGTLGVGGDRGEVAREGRVGLLGQVAPRHQHQGAAAEGLGEREEHDRLARSGRRVHPCPGGAVLEAAGELVERLELVGAQHDVRPRRGRLRERPREVLAGRNHGGRLSSGMHSVRHLVPSSRARAHAGAWAPARRGSRAAWSCTHRRGSGIRSPSVRCGATERHLSTRVGAHNVTVPTGVPASIATGAALSMTADLDPASAEPPRPEQSGGRPWVRPVVLVLSCLIIGFVGGWIWRGDDGPATVLPPAASPETGDTGSVTTGGGATTTRTTPPPATSTAEAPVLPPERSAISLAVLNGTSKAGYAADVAGQAEGLGYTGVVTGNAPSASVLDGLLPLRPAAGRRAGRQGSARSTPSRRSRAARSRQRRPPAPR